MPVTTIFQHVATFYSLIVGLAVANVLGAMASTAKTGARVRWYWMHAAAGGLVLLILVQDWWYLLSWDEAAGRLTHPILVFLLARAGALFFASTLLVPEAHDAEDGLLDLRAHMLRVRRPFFATLLAYASLDLGDTLLKGPERLAALDPSYPAYVTLSIGATLVATVVRSERVAGAVIAVLLIVHVTAILGRAMGFLV